VDNFYNTPEWLALRARAIARDRGRCTVARLLGGRCGGRLHVHHIVPRAESPELALDLDNAATVCGSHHPIWESLRRTVVEKRERRWRRCTHAHRYPGARAACERRLNGVRAAA
jgi:5-methylcytosine-specific restriction endonuclease McrA